MVPGISTFNMTSRRSFAIHVLLLLSAAGGVHAFSTSLADRSPIQVAKHNSCLRRRFAADTASCRRKKSRRFAHISSLHSSNDNSEENESNTNNPDIPARPHKQYFATCVPGLENVLANELIELGASNVETSGNSGVSFTNSPHDRSDIGLKALLWLRTAHRVMELITTTLPGQYDGNEQCYIYDSNELYDFIRATVHVQSLLGDGRGGLLNLSVHAISNGRLPRELCHTHYTSLSVKNALVDAVRDLRDDGVRPDVNLKDADVPLVVVLRGYDGRSASVSLYRCLHSGGSLHRRGYRRSGGGYDDSQEDGGGGGVVHKAALKESLAAGLLLEAGWDKLCAAAKSDGLPAVLIDPTAGSGTFPIEAALIAADIAPGLMRIRSFSKYKEFNPHKMPPAVRWKDGDTKEWKALLGEATSRAKAGIAWIKGVSETFSGRKNCEILANEINSRAADLARASIANAGFSGSIVLHETDCVDWHLGGDVEDDDGSRIPVEGRTIVVANPPWGKRLTDDIEESWESLKTFLRRECDGIEAWILSGNKSLTRILRMKKSRSLVIRTGDEDLRWIQYHIFKKKPAEGSIISEGVERVGVKRRGAPASSTGRIPAPTRRSSTRETDPWD